MTIFLHFLFTLHLFLKTAIPEVQMISTDGVLRNTGQAAVAMLFFIYTQAAIRGDLWSNPNWTISNVMVYPYNQLLTHLVIFPAFVTICVVYSVKLKVLRVRVGSAVAVVGAIGLIAHPVNTDPRVHAGFAFVIFLSSYFWYPECKPTQFRNFGVSSVLFIGGFALDEANNKTEILGGLLQFLPSVCCMIGELGIFVTWGSMVQNKSSGINCDTSAKLNSKAQ